jgi:hypothetical protein
VRKRQNDYNDRLSKPHYVEDRRQEYNDHGWQATTVTTTNRGNNVITLPQTIFEQTLTRLSLPPLVPKWHTALITERELWVMLQQLWDFYKRMYPFGTSTDSPIARDRMRKLISSPSLFNCCLFSQAVRNHAAEGAYPGKRRLVLELYARSVEEVNQNMTDSSVALSDDNLWAVLLLASHSVPEDGDYPNSLRPAPTQGPLTSLRWLDHYGAYIAPTNMHIKALLRMVEIRGGFDALSLDGLGALICVQVEPLPRLYESANHDRLEMISATKGLRRPTVSYFGIEIHDLDDLNWRLECNRRTDHPLRSMGSAFQRLRSVVDSSQVRDLVVILNRLALYSLAVDDYIAGRPMRYNLPTLSEHRNYVHFEFIRWLPNVEDPSQPAHALLSLIHLCGLIYSLLCVFPIPKAPFAGLVKRVKHLLENHVILGDTRSSGVLLWALWMTGIACVGLTERPWIVDLLRRQLRKCRINQWSDMRTILLEHLWLPITNDFDGVDLWEEITESYISAGTR